MTPRARIEPVGVLESCFGRKFGIPRQPRLVPASTARLRIRAEFRPEQSLRGLAGFSHVWLLSYMHLNAHERFVPVVHPPRLGGKGVGVFASRSPHRPSPIGLSLARLVKVAGDTLHLAEIDLADGTPIVDVKPFVPAYDRAPRARSGWAGAAPERRLRVSFAPEAARALAGLGAPGRALRALIRQALSNDPRNPRDRSQLVDGKPLDCWLGGREVLFRVAGRRLRVTAVVPLAGSKVPPRKPTPWG